MRSVTGSKPIRNGKDLFAEKVRTIVFSEYKEQALRIDPNINPDVFLLPASLPMCFSHDGCGPDFHGIMDSLGIDIVENGNEDKDKDEDEDKIVEGHTSRTNRACAPQNTRDVKTSCGGTAQTGK